MLARGDAAVISSSMTRLNGHAKFDDRYVKPMHGTVVFSPPAVVSPTGMP
jgi:hypothetical protein